MTSVLEVDLVADGGGGWMDGNGVLTSLKSYEPFGLAAASQPAP